METIVFKAPVGTKARLRRLNSNISALMREQAERLVRRGHRGSAFEKAEDLCGSANMSVKASTSKAYLRQYAKKGAD